MRKIEVRTVEDINVMYVDGEPTTIQYTKDDMNFMLDDLATSLPSRSRDDILAEFIGRTPAQLTAFVHATLAPARLKSSPMTMWRAPTISASMR
jgi:hypothetical protein